MRKFRFYKDIDYKWYVDLPEWEGSQADLQMVMGADTMLDIFSSNGTEVTLEIRPDHFNGADELRLREVCPEDISGAMYDLLTFRGKEVNHEMWLCDVMLFIFGRFPETLYIK